MRLPLALSLLLLAATAAHALAQRPPRPSPPPRRAHAVAAAPAAPSLRVVVRGPFVALAGPRDLVRPTAPATAPPPAMSGGRRYLRATGFAVLGATLGGGLGALVGRVDLDTFDRDARERSIDDPEVLAAPFGIVLGSAVGAMGGAGTPLGGGAVAATAAGSVFGGLVGLMGGAALSNGDTWGLAAGGVLGSASGAALAATRFRAVSGHRAGPGLGGAALGVRDGRVRLGVPSTRVAVIGAPVRMWHLVRVRW